MQQRSLHRHLLVSSLLAVLAAGAYANAAEAREYTAARKVGRGLAAMTCGFLEVPGNIVEVGREKGMAWGLTYGFVRGLGNIVVRELVGVYEFLTSPVAVPDGFVPIMEPEFPWDYFDEHEPRTGTGTRRGSSSRPRVR